MHKYLSGVLISICMMVAGCDPATDPTDPSNTDDYIYGEVTITDEYSNPVVDRTGADVTVTASNGKVYATKTKSDGTWRLDDLPAEVYSIRVSSTIYNLRTELDSMHNMQYVGHGAYKVQDFRLAQMMSSTMYYDAKVEITWRPVKNHLDSTIIDDSVATVTLTYATRNTTKASMDVVALAENPSDDCSQSLASEGGVGVAQKTESTRSLDIYSFHAVAKKKFGSTLRGRTLYIQIRPSFWSFDPVLLRQVSQCIEPVVVPLTF